MLKRNAVAVCRKAHVAQMETVPNSVEDYLAKNSAHALGLNILAWGLQHQPAPWGNPPGPSITRACPEETTTDVLSIRVLPATLLPEFGHCPEALAFGDLLSRVDVEKGFVVAVNAERHVGAAFNIARVRYAAHPELMDEELHRVLWKVGWEGENQIKSCSYIQSTPRHMRNCLLTMRQANKLLWGKQPRTNMHWYATEQVPKTQRGQSLCRSRVALDWAWRQLCPAKKLLH